MCLCPACQVRDIVDEYDGDDDRRLSWQEALPLMMDLWALAMAHAVREGELEGGGWCVGGGGLPRCVYMILLYFALCVMQSAGSAARRCTCVEYDTSAAPWMYGWMYG